MLTTSFVVALTLGAISCNETPKPADTKEIAEEHNDAKFDNNAKEKDAQFLVNAAELNLEEIELSLLAQHKSKSMYVLDLAKMMEDGHRKAMNELTELALSKIVTIPTTATDNAKESYENINQKNGNSFDRAYCTIVVDAHTNAVSLFEKIIADSKDEDIKVWASSTLPILRQHLDKAIDAKKKSEKLN